jgi:hypothetical protein
MHHTVPGCTFYKRDFGRNGFCQCDGFVAVDVKEFTDSWNTYDASAKAQNLADLGFWQIS